MSMSSTLGRVVSSKIADPLQLWKKRPDIVDPLNLTDAQQIKSAKEEDARYRSVITKAGKLQKDINKRYGLQGQMTILGG